MVKLNIGSGARVMPGYTNIDGGNYPGVTHHDITKLPFEDNSVAEIYSCHVIAYFSRAEIIKVLQEWKRVLAPGGIMRLATPDFDALMDIYIKQSVPVEKLLGLLYGEMGMGDQKIYHKTVYNYPSLVWLLEELGFTDVDEYDWRETEFAAIDDHSKCYFPHDLEAIRTQNFREDQTLMSLNIVCRK